jgi:hypothetical protein
MATPEPEASLPLEQRPAPGLESQSTWRPLRVVARGESSDDLGEEMSSLGDMRADTFDPETDLICPVDDGSVHGAAGTNFTRSGTMRYEHSDTEAAFLVFSHEQPVGRLLLIQGMTLARLIPNILTMWTSKTYLMSFYGPLVLGLLSLIVCLTLEFVVARLPPAVRSRLTVRRRAFLSEYLVVVAALVIRINEISRDRVASSYHGYSSTAGDVIIRTTRLSSETGTLVWYMCFAPIRLVTAAPALVALVVTELATDFLLKGASSAADYCGSTVVLFEVLATTALLWAWERDRREYFEARSSLMVQAARGAALVAVLRDELQHCNSDASLPPTSTTIVAHNAAVIVLRIVPAANVPLLPVKQALVDAVEKIADGLSTSVHRFGSAGTTMCIVLGLADVERPTNVNVNVSSESSAVDPADRPAMDACALARCVQTSIVTRLHSRSTDNGRSSEDFDDVKLRIGVARGEVRAHMPAGEHMYRDLIVVGDPVRVAMRLAEFAMPGTVLTNDATRNAASAAYAFTAMNDMMIEGTRLNLYLLGMPWTDEAHSVEDYVTFRTQSQPPSPAYSPIASGRTSTLAPTLHRLPAFTRFVTEASKNAPSAGRRDVGNPLQANAPVPAGVAENFFTELVEKDKEKPTLRWSWFFGWYFLDPVVEDEFRAQECRGTSRFVCCGALVLFCFNTIGWLITDADAIPPAAWACCVFALLLSFATFFVARPPRLGQRRLLLLTLGLARPAILLLTVAMILHGNPANPMKLYLSRFVTHIGNALSTWLPSALPLVALSIMRTLTQFAVAVLLGFEFPSWVYILQLEVFGLLVSMAFYQTLRLRNRWLFSAKVTARSSAERWMAARDRLRTTFTKVMPEIVARRIVALGTRSMIRGWRGHASLDSMSMEWLDSHLNLTIAHILAFRLERASGSAARLRRAPLQRPANDDPERAATTAATGEADDPEGDELAALVAVSTFLYGEGAALLPPRSFISVSGHTWIVVTPDNRNVHIRATAARCKSILRALASLPSIAGKFQILSGFTSGQVTGRLLGERRRRYEIIGPAIEEAVCEPHAGTHHWLLNTHPAGRR